MNKRMIAAAFLLATVTGFTSCSRKVTRIDPATTVDVSGSWNNTDSRMVADEMITDADSHSWIADHTQRTGKKPVVIVGMVVNKSHEHIEAETFMKDLERVFINNGKITLVQSGQKRDEIRAERADQQTNSSVSTMKKFGLESGADYILQGSINSIVDAYKRRKTVTYQVNLELTNLQTNEVVWIGDKKISKYVKN